jgi:diguanylate cyclase (GGDEF)-like protein/PAS domain S-box-containing protein
MAPSIAFVLIASVSVISFIAQSNSEKSDSPQVAAAHRSTLITGLGLAVIVFLLFLMMRLSERRARLVANRAQSDIAKAKALYENALSNAPIGVALVHKDGSCFFANEALLLFVGLDHDVVVGKKLRELITADDRFAFSEMWSTLESRGLEKSSGELRFDHSDGRHRWGSISAQAVYDDDVFQYFVVQVEDTTERRSIAERLEYQAIHDPLTGLPNRLLFVDRLEVALQRSKRTGLGVTVLFLDLDRFKIVNDSLGHAAGDQLLEAVAERIKASVRPNDTIARFGGDEFVILCEDISDERQTEEIAERLLENIKRPITLPEDEVYVTASIGIARSLAGEETPETILRDADTAMYRAKDAGRNRSEVFDERTHARAVANLETGNGMFRALENNEFRVRYQPVISLASGRLSGFEALVYWQHPERGHIGPDEFISLAEETGIIVPLGIQVFKNACEQLKRWHDFGGTAKHLTMSVNLSPRQIAEPTLVDEIEKAIKETGVNPTRLWFEITETTLMVDAKSTILMLEQLRNLGVHFEVDDFGTGFSSLSYLKKFPVDALKIDQGFIDGLGHDPEDSAIVTAVVSLAHALGLQAIAEGVETPLQMAELKTLGCEYAQGYLYAKPASASTWDEIVQSNELFTFAEEKS